MLSYIIRRLLLIIPTFFGTTLLVFWILNIIPDGPFDQDINAIKAQKAQSGPDGKSGANNDDKASTEVGSDVRRTLEREYGLNNGVFWRYLIWLGVAPKEVAYKTSHEINTPYRHTIKRVGKTDSKQPIALQQYVFPITINKNLNTYQSGEGTNFDFDEYSNIENINFDIIGYIPSIQAQSEAYLYTMKKIETSKDSEILLQKYIVVDCGPCDEKISPNESKFIVWESGEGTNFDFDGYETLPKDPKAIAKWKESSDWIVKKNDPNCIISKSDKTTCSLNLSLNKKDTLLSNNDFKNHWSDTNWDVKKVAIYTDAGDAEENEFNIFTDSTIVSGFSILGKEIPSGCGTLTELDFVGNASGLSNIKILDSNGKEIDFKYNKDGVRTGALWQNEDWIYNQMTNSFDDYKKELKIIYEKFNIELSDESYENIKRKWDDNFKVESGCDLPEDNSLYLTSTNKIYYKSSKNIGFFRFNVDGDIDKNRVELSLSEHQGIFTGYLGQTNEGESVSQKIWERLHISSFFGITGFILSYLVCIPLGIAKALRHGSKFDFASSGLVFIGYSIPAYAFGVVMIWLFASTSSPFIDWGWFDKPMLPSMRWRPDNWEDLSLIGKIIEQLRHAFLPTLCYMLSSFATLTVLMKNSLMENMSQDYVRTAFAKGLKERTVIFKHAVRNSLIPLATGIGGLIGLFLAGSYLIEKVFEIQGIGILGFESIEGRDIGIFMGFLVIGTVIRLVGNLISDLCYAAIDPRIRFK